MEYKKEYIESLTLDEGRKLIADHKLFRVDNNTYNYFYFDNLDEANSYAQYLWEHLVDSEKSSERIWVNVPSPDIYDDSETVEESVSWGDSDMPNCIHPVIHPFDSDEQYKNVRITSSFVGNDTYRLYIEGINYQGEYFDILDVDIPTDSDIVGNFEDATEMEEQDWNNHAEFYETIIKENENIREINGIDLMNYIDIIRYEVVNIFDTAYDEDEWDK